MLIKLQGFRGDKWNYCSGQNIITKYFLNDLVQSVKIMNTRLIRAENCKHLQISISFRKFHFYNAKMLHWYIKLILSSSANCLQSRNINSIAFKVFWLFFWNYWLWGCCCLGWVITVLIDIGYYCWERKHWTME